jgi:hypothetical protein
VAGALAQAGEVGQIVAIVADRLGAIIPNPVMYWLTQTTVLACLASLQRGGQACVRVSENRLGWKL